nr:hypothetical protein [Tanacetum cinerariifolium]
KIENLNEVKVKELRSDNKTEFKNHKLEELYDENENVINDQISDAQTSPITILPSYEVILQSPVPQDRRSREKHIELVNIIGEPLAGITARSWVRDSEAASAHECLLDLFYGVSDGCEKCIFNGKILKDVYVQQPPGFESIEFPYDVSEAKYAVATGCYAQVLWIKSQLADYDYSRTTHIDIMYNFIRDHI